MTLFDTGAALRLGDDVWRHDRGRVLVGGAPLRVMRLAPEAAVRLRTGVLRPTDGVSRALYDRLLDAGLAHPDPRSLPPVSAGDLTAVIPTLGRVDQVERLVGSLAGIPVVIVDDGSPRADAARLAALATRTGATLVRLDVNGGPANARNAGLRAVETPFVAFVDSDARTSAADLLVLARHFADPGLAVVGPRIVGSAASDSWIERYEDSRSSLDLGERPALVRPRSTVSWISSTCLLARTAAIGSGFTAGMRVAEDVDLVWRLAEEGRRVRYEPRVAVLHTHRTRLAPWFARKFFYGTGAAALARTHPQAIPPAILRPWSLVAVALLLTMRWWGLAGALATATGAGIVLRRRVGTWMPPGLTAKLVASGLVSTAAQLSALALRHWWPVGVVVALLSRRARVVIGVAAVVDAVVEHRRLRSRLDPVRFGVARRLDDIAYGGGVWFGALRARSARALLPELLPSERRRRS